MAHVHGLECLDTAGRVVCGNGRAAMPDPATMTAGQINKALDRLDAERSENTRAFIDAGRGYERPSEYLLMTDPLALEARRIFAAQDALRREIGRRYGPGAPYRLPTRGFGPVKGW